MHKQSQSQEWKWMMPTATCNDFYSKNACRSGRIKTGYIERSWHSLEMYVDDALPTRKESEEIGVIIILLCL